MRSMTGFGAAEGKSGAITLSAEVRSVNQRHLDVKIVGPREYGAWESELRREVAAAISRGRVDVFISRTLAPGARSIAINKKAAAAYVAAWRELRREFDLEGDVSLALLQARPEIFQPAGADVDPAGEIEVLKRVLARALQAHGRERAREGAHLARDIGGQAKQLRALVARLRTRSSSVAPRLRRRLEERLEALLGGRGVDPARLAQEAAVLAERADVSEEIVRLGSHFDALAGLVKDSGAVGKRIEFLLQEINRELNTIGSKAGDLEITNLVIDGKAAVEKIREQVQNVE
jgi:uncharacterized protein (TIGR00255 family)